MVGEQMSREIMQIRYNIFEIDSMKSFASISGAYRNGQKDVSFVRLLGVNHTYGQDVKEMDGILSELAEKNKLYYKCIDSLPKLKDTGDAAFYAGCYEEWHKNGNSSITIKVSQNNRSLGGLLSCAYSKAAEAYFQKKGQRNSSIEKNLWVKFMYWYDSLFYGKIDGWTEKSVIKCVAANISKEQEYLFFYMLTGTGMDVLLLQNACDIDGRMLSLGLSKGVRLGEMGEAVPLPCLFDRQGEQGGRSQKHDIIHNRNAQPDIGSGQGQPAKSENIRVHIPRKQKQRRNIAENRERELAGGSFCGWNREINPVGEGSSPYREVKEKNFEELALLASSVVMIAVHDASGEVVSTGSGIMVGRDGFILTNHHVTGKGSFYSVRIEDEEEAYVTDDIIKYHDILDLALLRIARRLNPLPVYQGKKKLVRGQSVVAVGSPMGLFNSVSEGIISGFRDIDGVGMIQFTAPISPGSSGGALINRSGEVIGISTAVFGAGQNLNLAVGYENINPFIRGFVG